MCILLKPGHYDTLYCKNFIKNCKLIDLEFPLKSDFEALYPEKGPEVNYEEEKEAQLVKEVRRRDCRRRRRGQEKKRSSEK